MGGHYGSIHVRTENANQVRAALEELSSKRETRFLLAPAIGGWVTAFPRGNGQDFCVAEALAEKIKDPLLHCLVHDDDVFAYQFCEGGILVDQYNSCPDYFGGEPAPRGGDISALGSIIPEANRQAELKKILDAERFDFEMERLERFASTLGLPNAVSAYEYLQDGERHGIKRWKEFVHIPDQAAEKAVKRAAKAKAVAGMKQMAKDGLLVFGMVGQKTSHRLFHSSPIWCLDPNTSEVLLAWTGSPIGIAAPTRVSRINTQTGIETATKVEVSSHIDCMAVNSTGAWIAAGCAFGDWKTQVWDLASGDLVMENPQSRAVERVCFNQDGQTLFSLSENTITVANLSGTRSIKTILLPDAARTMVLHPDGEHIAVVCQGMLAVVHLPTGTVLKSLWIPSPPGPERDMLEQAMSGGIEQRFLSSIEGSVSKEVMADTRARMARHFLPKQGIHSLSFGSLGNYLFCGTNSGVNMLEWDKVLAASDMASIKPTVFVQAEQHMGDDGRTANQLIYAVPVDSIKRRILFAGLEGKAKFANVSDGQLGDLLTPPVRRPFWQLELTPDRTALVGTAIPKRDGSKPARASFQIWNYKALCVAANLDW